MHAADAPAYHRARTHSPVPTPTHPPICSPSPPRPPPPPLHSPFPPPCALQALPHPFPSACGSVYLCMVPFPLSIELNFIYLHSTYSLIIHNKLINKTYFGTFGEHSVYSKSLISHALLNNKHSNVFPRIIRSALNLTHHTSLQCLEIFTGTPRRGTTQVRITRIFDLSSPIS